MAAKRYENCTPPENLFANLFVDTFGAEKAEYLCPQYHFYDIYQGSRYADFMVEAATISSWYGEYGWRLINGSNRKELFVEMVHQMDMSYSYQPLFAESGHAVC